MINLINSIILKTSKDKELINKSANEIKRKVLTKKRLENAKFTQKI